jgi:hypothetical protein
MSEKWRKRRGQRAWALGPYVVAEEPDGDGDHRFEAVRSGDNPERVATVSFDPGDKTAIKRAMGWARAACENHRLLAEPDWEPGRQLVWLADEPCTDGPLGQGTWVAPGTPYRVSSDSDWTVSLYGDTTIFSESSEPTRDAAAEQAKAACQAHLETTLVWRHDSGGEWYATSRQLEQDGEREAYRCRAGITDRTGIPARSSAAFPFAGDETEWRPECRAADIGPDEGCDSLERAQAICQEHHRAEAACENHRGTVLKWEADGLVAVGDSWQAGDYRCEQLPSEDWAAYHRSRPGLARVCPWEQLDGLYKDADAAKEACQEHHHAALAGEQPDPDESEVHPERQAAVRRRVTRAMLCQLSAEEKAEALQAAAETDIEADELQRELAEMEANYKADRKALLKELAAKRQQAQSHRLLWSCGETMRDIEVLEELGPEPEGGGAREVISYDPATGEELDRRLATAEELQAQLPGVDDEGGLTADGVAERLEAAIKELGHERAGLLLWPGEPDSGTLLDSTGRYQLTRHGDDAWEAARIGGLDEGATELGMHSLEEAKAACQAHADGRAEA